MTAHPEVTGPRSAAFTPLQWTNAHVHWAFRAPDPYERWSGL